MVQTRQEHKLNGVDVEELKKAIKRFADPQQAKFRFKAQNRWLSGGRNRSEIFHYQGGSGGAAREQPFVMECDEPPEFLGTDQSANPVEYLLHALAGCLTTTMVVHAAARGIRIESVESQLEGDIDVRGFFGIDPQTPKGYQQIRVTLRVVSDAPAERLAELARFSPVYNTITQAVPVEVNVQKSNGQG